MPDQEIEVLLHEFLSGEPVRQHRAVIDLLAKRLHHAAAADRRFDTGLQSLHGSAGGASDPHDRLLAVATLVRVGASVKRLRRPIEARLADHLHDVLPDPGVLTDPDDRKYIADACAVARPSWAAEYSARAAALEEAGEQARSAFMRALVAVSPALDQALGQLVGPMKTWTPTTEAPADSAARRLRRVLLAVRTAMADTSIDPGLDPGRAVCDILRAALAGGGTAPSERVAREAAEEVAAVLHELVRLRFSLATDGRTFEALRIARGWLPGRSWESFAAKSPASTLVAQDLTEAMLILARQGVTDDGLLDLLGTAAGSRERAREKSLELSKKSGIPDSVRSWLASGRKAPHTPRSPTSESALMEENIFLADLLVDAQRFRVAEAAGRREMLPELGMLQPRLAQQLERLLNLSLGLCDAIEAIGRKRGLRLRGSPGKIEEYSPVDHETVDGVAGTRHVRVLRPLVEQVREDGTPFVLRRGVVESVR